MMTVRQIERQWESRVHDRLFKELISARPEGALRLGIDMSRPVCAAALAVIRLDELSQSHVKLYSTLVKSILAGQESDGGWGDLITTALCLRALLCGNGNGLAIEHGMKYLADLQKSEGIWPNVPIRRMPADPYVSALILYQLADQRKFRDTVRLAEAVRWFAAHDSWLDEPTRELWRRASRSRLPAPVMQPSLS